MKILIAEDDVISRRVLETTMRKWDYEIEVAEDGKAAWQMLQSDNGPRLALLDWMMPEMDGLEICRKARAELKVQPYLILVTAKTSKESTVTGLDGGADDYICKPFHREELRARLQAGRRILELQVNLANQVHQLQKALGEVKRLHGLLPMCTYCKKIRDDKNYWRRVEEYITEHSEARISHGICGECYQNVIEPQLRDLGINSD